MQCFKIHCRCQKTRKNGKAIVKIPDAKRQNVKNSEFKYFGLYGKKYLFDVSVQKIM